MVGITQYYERVRLRLHASAARFAAPFLGCLLVLTGCGGGGKKSPSHWVEYRTDWTGVAVGSQRITLSKLDGTPVSQRVINSESTAAKFAVDSEGTYTLRVELNSGRDFSGSTTGTLTLEAADKSTVRSVATGTPTSLVLQPSSITVDKGATIQLSLAAKTSGGTYTFVAPGSIGWKVDNANATVTSDGRLTGVAYGNFKVTATQASSGVTATAPASVATTGSKRTKWTVFIYLSSANNLYPYALPNLNQMESVANADLRFVVQWKEAKSIYPAADFEGTRRYVLKPDQTPSLNADLVQDLGTGVDMGKAQTLKEFLDWGTRNYPADHYATIIWSHGDGWHGTLRVLPTRATSYDDQFLSAINVWDIPGALQGHHFDIISFDACLMQMMEVVTEIAPYADYIAASAENTPAAGYPYDQVFGAFAQNPDAPVRTLTQSFVTGHVGNPSYANQNVTQSVLDSTQLGALQTTLDELGATLAANRSELGTIIPTIRTDTPKYGNSGDGRYFYDLGVLLDKLIASSAPTAVVSKAQAAKTALANAVIFNGGSNPSAYTQGLAIDFSASSKFNPTVYSHLKFAQNTRWDDWLAVAP